MDGTKGGKVTEHKPQTQVGAVVIRLFGNRSKSEIFYRKLKYEERGTERGGVAVHHGNRIKYQHR